MDFMALMKQATELKSKMEALQAELDTIEVEGTAGGGMVTMTMTAKGDVRSVHIDPSLMKSEDNEADREVLKDLIVAAHADARRRAEATLQDKMKTLAGGLPLPPGMKLF